MTDRWGPPCSLGDLMTLFGLGPGEIVTLAETSLMRTLSASAYSGAVQYQVYGLGWPRDRQEVVAQAAAARRLQGCAIPPDCPDWQERNVLLAALRLELYGNGSTS